MGQRAKGPEIKGSEATRQRARVVSCNMNSIRPSFHPSFVLRPKSLDFPPSALAGEAMRRLQGYGGHCPFSVCCFPSSFSTTFRILRQKRS